MKKKFFKKALAFTLAEVLITLSILGVVAAITVPSLIKRQHRNEVETKLKKFASTIETAMSVSIAENGPMERWTVPDGTSDENKAVILANKYIIPYLDVVGDIPTTPVKKWDAKNPKTGNNANTEQGWWGRSSSTYQLKDGTTFGVSDFWNNYWLMSFRVDINGKKGPNVVGKDNFVFVYTSLIYDDIVPSLGFGAPAAKETHSKLINDCKAGRNFDMCSTLIVKNHWKIPDDYPWL